MLSSGLPPIAFPRLLVMVLLLTAGMRHIDIMIPPFLHEIDRVATRM